MGDLFEGWPEAVGRGGVRLRQAERDQVSVGGLAALLSSGQVDLQTVAQDGLRVRASAGSGSYRREPRLRDLHRLANDWLARVEAALAEMAEARARRKRNKGKPEQARVPLTDPQARVMRMPDGGFRPACNVQFCAETRHGLVVGVAVGNSGADQDALDPMQAKIVRDYGRAPAEVLVDGGFVSKTGIKRAQARGSAVYAPVGTTAPAPDSGAVGAWRARMQAQAATWLYRQRAQTIEWVNARVRNNGLHGVRVRGLAKCAPWRCGMRWRTTYAA